MNLDKLVAVSGLGGIFKIAANRNNGLIIEDYDTGKRRFVGSRKHQFTPLGSVTIYSQDPEDIIKLSEVFEAMLEKKADLVPPPPKSAKEELHAYFGEIMPKYDRDMVHASDMKKLIKWFNYLEERNIFAKLEEEEQAEEAAKEAETEADAKTETEETAEAETEAEVKTETKETAEAETKEEVKTETKETAEEINQK